jgi:hypothetical protein
MMILHPLLGHLYLVEQYLLTYFSRLFCVAALARFGRVRCYSWTFLLGGLASAAVAIILWTTERGSQAWGNCPPLSIVLDLSCPKSTRYHLLFLQGKSDVGDAVQ